MCKELPVALVLSLIIKTNRLYRDWNLETGVTDGSGGETQKKNNHTGKSVAPVLRNTLYELF